MTHQKPKIRNTLESLHEVFASELKDGLVHGMRAVDKEGNEVRQPANPAYLNVIRQFLKDNNIQATASNGNSLEAILLSLQGSSIYDGTVEDEEEIYLPAITVPSGDIEGIPSVL